MSQALHHFLPKRPGSQKNPATQPAKPALKSEPGLQQRPRTSPHSREWPINIQYTVSGPAHFHKVHRCGSFPSETDRDPYFESVSRRLAGSSQVRTGAGCSQGAVTQPLRAPRVDHQPAQESAVAQIASCLSGNNFRLCPNAGMAYAGTIPDYSVIGGVSQTGNDTPPKGVSEASCPYGGQHLCDSSGPASHAAPSVLAQSLRSIPRLAPGAASCQGRPPLYQGCGPLDDLSNVPNRNEVRPDLQKEGSHSGRVQLGLGHPAGGQSGVRLLSAPEQSLHTGFPVAQMVEHGASSAKIMGSIPRESKSWSNVKIVT